MSEEEEEEFNKADSHFYVALVCNRRGIGSGLVIYSFASFYKTPSFQDESLDVHELIHSLLLRTREDADESNYSSALDVLEYFAGKWPHDLPPVDLPPQFWGIPIDKFGLCCQLPRVHTSHYAITRTPSTSIHFFEINSRYYKNTDARTVSRDHYEQIVAQRAAPPHPPPPHPPPPANTDNQ